MRYFIPLISAILLSCGQSNEKAPKAIPATPQAKKIEKKKADPVKKKQPIDLITNNNVEARLLAYGEKNPETVLLVKTTKGNIKIKLYKDTPLHRANFIMMAKNDCFDSTVFTRVAENFMAQAGGTYDQKMVDKRNSIGRYTIPAEIVPNHYHKKGTLGAARSYNNNPEKRSSAFAFYFVEGAVYNDLTLDKYEELNKYTFSPERRAYYRQFPGAAHIDGQHTVFGEVLDGFDVIPLLTHVETDSRDWPKQDIYIIDIEIIE